MKVLAIIAVLAGVAHADVKVDWAAGLVTADAVGVADRHAPSPAVARGTSRRVAEDAARALIKAKLGDLPVAAGGKLADKVKELDGVVARAFAVSAEPETDGAWKVTMAVPIEALRQAIAGPRELAKDGDSGPAVVVVDGAAAKPAIGWTVGGVAGATIFVPAVPAWAKDAPHVTAKSAKNGAIEVAKGMGSPGTLFVIVEKS